MEETSRAGIIIHDRTGHEFEKSFGKQREIYVTNFRN
jgi:hypothetical protein